MGIETLYAIMLPDNHRAIDLTRKMGFTLRYIEDGTVKGTLDLKEEMEFSREEPESQQETQIPKEKEAAKEPEKGEPEPLGQ